MSKVVQRRPRFEGIERGLDNRTLKSMRVLASIREHSARVVLIVACGGLWTDDRMARRSTGQPHREDILARVQVYGLGIQFPTALPTFVEPPVVVTAAETLFTDGSGKHPGEPSHRRCGCGISGRPPEFCTLPLPGCWQSVYRAELHAIMLAYAEVVANKFKAGLRKPHGRHSRMDTRIRDAIGDSQVKWTKSFLTLDQAGDA
eukprot:6147310-Amphidinium_carterae.1